MIRALAMLAVLAAAAPARATPRCDSGPLPPQVTHGNRRQIAGTGGVIVAAGFDLPDWRFRIVNRLVRPLVVHLAPGLAIYHPPPPLGGIDVVLENAEHEIVDRSELALTPGPLLEAPRVRSITTGKVRSRDAVLLAVEALPETAVIAVIMRVQGSALVPMAWSFVRFTDPASIEIWHVPMTCEPKVGFLLEPKEGMRVAVVWVDELGRVSEPSKPTVITGGSKRK
jgi:hypothetical protein